MSFIAGFCVGFLVALFWAAKISSEKQEEIKREHAEAEQSANHKIEMLRISHQAMDDKINCWADEVRELRQQIQRKGQ